MTLEEYENREGMLHISEIASRGVKNIKDKLTEKKSIICKVIRVDESRGYIDVSLKRVSDGERKIKTSFIRAEKRLAKQIELLALNNKKTLKDVESEFLPKLYEHYDSLVDLFTAVKSAGLDVLNSLDLPKFWLSILNPEFERLIKEARVSKKKEFLITCFESDGVERIKKLIIKLKEEFPTLDAQYLGTPRYTFCIEGKDAKTVDLIINNLNKKALELSKGLMINFESK